MKTIFKKGAAFTLAFAALLAVEGNSQIIVFDGTDGSLDLNLASGSVIQSGLQLTLSANDGIVNATTSGLGINDSLSGDDTDGLDTLNTIEILTLSFDKEITFDSITLASMGVDDGLRFSFNGGTPIDITSSGTTVFGETLLAGQFLTITAFEPNSPTANNGVNITGFQVTAIPEPSSALLLLLGALGLAYFRRRS